MTESAGKTHTRTVTTARTGDEIRIAGNYGKYPKKEMCVIYDELYDTFVMKLIASVYVTW